MAVDVSINLPGGGPSIAGVQESGDNRFIQVTRDPAVVQAVVDLASAIGEVTAAVNAQTTRVDLVTAAVGQVTAKLAADPLEGGDLAPLITAVNNVTTKLSSDPSTGTQVQALGTLLNSILAKQPTDPATGADVDAVTAQLLTIANKIPIGGATDAHMDLVTTAVNAVAAKLPAGMATNASVDAVTTAITAMASRLPSTGAASESTLAAINGKMSGPLATSSDIASVVTAITGQNSHIDAITSKLTSDPPTGTQLAALRSDVQAVTAKLSSDPSTGTQVQALGTKLDAILAKQSSDPAESTDFDGVISAVNAVTAKIPTGGATDAHVDLVTTAVNAAASVLPTGAATDTSVQAITTAVNAVTAKLPTLASGKSPVDPTIADQIVTGSISVNSGTVDITPRAGDGLAGITLAGSFVGTISFYAVDQGANERALSVISVGASGTTTSITSTTTVGTFYQASIPPGSSLIRVKATAYTSGTANVTLITSRNGGNPYAAVSGSVGLSTVNTATSDGLTVSQANTSLLNFNGSSWDRQRSNFPQNLAASAARTATLTNADVTVHNARGLRLWINVTVAGTGGLTPRIEGKASTSGAYATIATRGAAISATGLYKLDIYPGITAGTDAFSAVLNRTVRAVIAAGDASSWTYSVDLELIV